MINDLFINRVSAIPSIGKVNVLLRKGLNIIRADKVDKSDEKGGPRNSLGKSTFVKLIDYGLGREDFLLPNEKNANKKLIDTDLLMEFSISKHKYTVKRNFVNGNLCKVFNGWVIDEIHQGKSIQGSIKDLDEYKSFLEELLFQGENFVNGEKLISLRQVSSVLIRNQLNGFANINEPIGVNEGAQVSRLRIEFLTGLTNAEKLETDHKLLEAEKNRKAAKTDYDIIKRYLNRKGNYNLKEILSEITSIESNINNIEDIVKELKEKIVNVEKTQSSFREEKVNYLSQIESIKRDVMVNNSRILNYNATYNQISHELETIEIAEQAKSILNKLDYEQCPVCLIPIDKNDKTQTQCPRATHKDGENVESVIETINNILKNEQKDLMESIAALKLRNDVLNDRKLETQNKIKLINTQLESGIQSLLNELIEKENEILRQNEEKSKLIVIKDGLTDIETYKKDWQKYVNDKKDLNKRLKAMNLQFEENKNLLENTYDQVVRYLYDNTRRGIVNYSKKAGNFSVDIGYINDGESIDNGAAAQNVKVIAFDLALLKLSVITDTYQPHFLVHDSPNVNDIDSEIYSRIFSFVYDMEKELMEQGKEINFQYIITTILVPSEMDNDEKLIRLTLNNMGEEGKLFGFTF